ncbi:hypothetical protein FHG87_003563 [Trinorchestia longiramus]|nr:hypothetical protein FHG87_003563 [Trinorchestia longiramus]
MTGSESRVEWTAELRREEVRELTSRTMPSGGSVIAGGVRGSCKGNALKKAIAGGICVFKPNSKVSAHVSANVKVSADVSVSANVRLSPNVSVYVNVSVSANVNTNVTVNADMSVRVRTRAQILMLDIPDDGMKAIFKSALPET